MVQNIPRQAAAAKTDKTCCLPNTLNTPDLNPKIGH
jgi:hypothetical protein